MSFRSNPRQTPNYGMVTMMCAKDPHTTLGVAHGASKQEIKAAYRRLALQYHPDVCKGDHCTTEFQHINSAYQAILSKAAAPQVEGGEESCDNVEGLMGVGDDSWEEWEDWMGWEGAGTLDYSDHINDST